LTRHVAFQGKVVDSEPVTGNGQFIVASSPTIENYDLMPLASSVTDVSLDGPCETYRLVTRLESSDDGGEKWSIVASGNVPHDGGQVSIAGAGAGELLRVTMSVVETGYGEPGSFSGAVISGHIDTEERR
jgi:hypothetical protein